MEETAPRAVLGKPVRIPGPDPGQFLKGRQVLCCHCGAPIGSLVELRGGPSWQVPRGFVKGADEVWHKRDRLTPSPGRESLPQRVHCPRCAQVQVVSAGMMPGTSRG